MTEQNHTRHNSYAWAAGIIQKLLIHQGSLDTQLNTALAKAPHKIHPAIKALCYETMRYYPRVELIARQLINKKLKPRDQDVHALLLIGLTAIEQQRTPDFAIINEIVNAAKQRNKHWATGFINGVLRQYTRQRKIKADHKTSMVFQFMQPQWLIERVSLSYTNQAASILSSLNAHPPMVLRVNLQKTDRSSYIDQLKQQGLTARPGTLSPVAVYLDKPVPIDKLPGFAQGLVSIQDEAAQLAAEYLDMQPGHRILDACAAPGGKACHILENQPEVKLDCLELDTKRAEKIQENLKRLDLSAKVKIGDASKQDWWDKAPYDRILLDAPCSGTGIIRRRPDIKLLGSQAHVDQLKKQQLQMLYNLWQILKPEGKLIYSTCSILPEENEQIIQSFIKQQKDAKLCFSKQLLPQILPQTNGHDGFYYAKIIKKQK